MAQAQRSLGEGYDWGGELALEQCFDRVNHDKLMRLVRERITERRVLQRIDRYLKAGGLTDGGLEATVEGTSQGGPLSPLLANLLLDGVDKELARRGQRFVRDADDGTISVRSGRAGPRVLGSVTRCVERRLKRRLHAANSAVDRPWRRTLRGFTVTGHRPNRRRVSEKALKAFTHEVRRLTYRTRGVARGQVASDLRRDLEGWYESFGFAEAPSGGKELDSWRRRRLRCYQWKQGGRRRYRALRRRGVSRDLAWHTVTSAHGSWRVSHRPALASALPGGSFDGLGVPRLHRVSRR